MAPPSSPDDHLCPRCLKPVLADSTFCGHCGAPLTPHATTDPVQSILAEGFAVRNATARPHKPIVLIGMWLLCLPGFSAGLIGLLLSLGLLARGQCAAVGGLAVSVGLLLLFGAILRKTTVNYVRARREQADADAEDE